MGGTFDPIHIAHLILGEQALHQCELDEIWYLPNGNPPHKRDHAGRATEEQRLYMTELAILNHPDFRVCDIEMKSEGYSYSFQTMEKLVLLYPDYDFFFIIGADSLFSLDSWMKPERLLKCCTMIAAVRDHASADDLKKEISRIQEVYPFARILIIDTPNMDLSSNMIREMVRNNRSIRYYVTDAVREYIVQHGIYRNDMEGTDGKL